MGIQSACWDLRVQPIPPAADFTREGREGQQGAARAEGQARRPEEPVSPFGAACAIAAPAMYGGPGASANGPLVPAGAYTIALVIDGKTVDSKPVRVTDDPEVVLTSIERKKMFDMATELHAIQPRLADAVSAQASLSRQLATIADTLGKRDDVPTSVKTSVGALAADVKALEPRLSQPPRGFGGNPRANEMLLLKLGQSKNVLMGGMPPTQQALNAFADVKAQTPKAIGDLNAAIAKAGPVAESLAKYNLKLTVPQAVKAVEAAPRKTSTHE